MSTESESSVGTEDTSKNGNQLPTTELCGPAVIENSRDGNGDEPTVQPTHLQISKNDPGKILPPSVPTNGTGNPATVANESSNTIDERNERSTNQNWKKSEEKLHQIEVLEREKWNRKEFLEHNSEDEFGFSVTHRTDEFIGRKPLRARAQGFKICRERMNLILRI